MATWSEVTRAAPELVAAVQRRFDAYIHKTLATLRADGSPRISGIEASFRDGEMWLINSNIPEYQQAGRFNHLPKRPRKLLLHKSEIRKLFGLAAVKGHALLPLSFYWKNGKVKVALAVGKGKAQFDKREDLKEREADRELKRAVMRRSKS